METREPPDDLVTDEVFELVAQNTPPEQIAAAYPWEALRTDEREFLLQSAAETGDDWQSYRLLQYLFRIGQDDWFLVRVLFLIIQHPRLPDKEQPGVMRTLRRTLDRLQRQFQTLAEDSAERRDLGVFEADYGVIEGRQFLETGNHAAAIARFAAAVQLYRGLGLQEDAAGLEQEMAQVQPGEAITGTVEPAESTPTPGLVDTPPSQMPVSDFELEDRLAQQQYELEGLEEKSRALQAKIDEQQQQVQVLEQSRSQLTEQEAQVKQRVIQAQKRLEELRREVAQQEGLRKEVEGRVSAADARVRSLRAEAATWTQKLEGLRTEAEQESKPEPKKSPVYVPDEDQIQRRVDMLQGRNQALEQRVRELERENKRLLERLSG